VCAVLSFFFVLRWVKETKGKELEEMRTEVRSPRSSTGVETTTETGGR
jgi:hypothetical protein